MSVITVEDVLKVFGRRASQALEQVERGLASAQIRAETGCTVALRDVGFEVEPGEFFVLMGLSGSGKSTLLRCLNGLIRPTRGSVRVQDFEVATAPPDELLRMRREQVTMVFQHFALLPHRTVAENAALGLEMRGVPRARRIESATEVLNMVGLQDWARSRPDELSGGMKQRVGLARALATGAPILLMDEPFSALDPLIRRDMQDELLRLQQTLQRTIVFVTHDLGEALKLGDRIAVMRGGEIVQIGTAEGILSQPADDYVAAFTQDVDRSRVFTARSVMRPVNAVPLSGGPRLAIRKMKELGLSTVFVTRRGGALAGMVSVDAALTALNRGDTTLESCVDRDVAVARADDSLLEVARLCADRRAPAAVLSEDGRLLGIITRIDLLSALSGLDQQVAPAAAQVGAAPGDGGVETLVKEG